MSGLRPEPAGPRVAFPPEAFRAILGPTDANLRLIEKTFGVRLAARDEDITVLGEQAAASTCARFLEQIARMAAAGFRFGSQDVAVACRLVREEPGVQLADHFTYGGLRNGGVRRPVIPRTPQQRVYLDAIRTNGIVFAIGPAGTGKTYLAVAMAVEALAARRVRRIVLCRPAVEAGERLGFLPGDLAQKVDPYLRPLYDALYDLQDGERARKMIEQGTIEVAPLAFMRGRTLNDSFIILDEAQNTTPEQMKMFLTRIGEGSKTIVTGDITQIDLPPGKTSGLIHAREVVSGIEGISFIHFTKRDVVRHELVQRIVHAYEKHEASNGNGANDTPHAASGHPEEVDRR